MRENEHGFLQQVRRNAVALISLVIAITSLGYNTWRNEQTEANRNQRQSAFEILLKLGELQQVVFHSHYDQDITDKGNPRTGWAHVLLVNDLAGVLNSPMPELTDRLRTVWGRHWDALGIDEASVAAIQAEIDTVRAETVRQLHLLE
ncbi:MAG: hypothetical protein KJO10_02740 [Gammaproteobacteria bacterium]|nr:hypothetical protein [Gammaproteobacteria bacterium]